MQAVRLPVVAALEAQSVFWDYLTTCQAPCASVCMTLLGRPVVVAKATMFQLDRPTMLLPLVDSIRCSACLGCGLQVCPGMLVPRPLLCVVRSVATGRWQSKPRALELDGLSRHELSLEMRR